VYPKISSRTPGVYLPQVEDHWYRTVQRRLVLGSRSGDIRIVVPGYMFIDVSAETIASIFDVEDA
jgi:hypothetical protein